MAYSVTVALWCRREEVDVMRTWRVIWESLRITVCSGEDKEWSVDVISAVGQKVFHWGQVLVSVRTRKTWAADAAILVEEDRQRIVDEGRFGGVNWYVIVEAEWLSTP